MPDPKAIDYEFVTSVFAAMSTAARRSIDLKTLPTHQLTEVAKTIHGVRAAAAEAQREAIRKHFANRASKLRRQAADFDDGKTQAAYLDTADANEVFAKNVEGIPLITDTESEA